MTRLNHFGLYHDRTKPPTSYYSPTLFSLVTNSVNLARKPVTAYNTLEFPYNSTRTDQKSLTTAPITKPVTRTRETVYPKTRPCLTS